MTTTMQQLIELLESIKNQLDNWNQTLPKLNTQSSLNKVESKALRKLFRELKYSLSELEDNLDSAEESIEHKYWEEFSKKFENFGEKFQNFGEKFSKKFENFDDKSENLGDDLMGLMDNAKTYKLNRNGLKTFRCVIEKPSK